MAVLEKMRKRMGVVISIVIAIALLAFIVNPDDLQRVMSMFSSKYDVGKIAGKSINQQEFSRRVEYYNNIAKLTGSNSGRSEEESELKGTKQELLIVIGNRGYSEHIMDAAREAGATGGTVIHANGTGMKRAEKFFGISLSSERELVLIVTATAKKNTIMQSIMKKAGLKTDAKAIVFSLPVTDTAGLRLLEPEESDEEPAAPQPEPNEAPSPAQE